MSNDLHSLVDHISCDEVDLEIRLEEISKENSMLRSINEMILHEGACQKPTRRFEDPAPLKHRIKELELFLFNLGSEVRPLIHSQFHVRIKFCKKTCRIRLVNCNSPRIGFVANVCRLKRCEVKLSRFRKRWKSTFHWKIV